MATSGPVSVLDNRSMDTSSSVTVVRDRITRHQSPGRYSSHSLLHADADTDEFTVSYRIPQPYRTSFSATHSIEKVGGRSRSLSPASSLRSGRSGRSGWGGRSRSKSPSAKRVTYDSRVTVRHSTTGDSMFAELSAREFDSSACSPCSLGKTSRGNYGKNLNHSVLSADSGIDYSSELRDISQQICKMDWSSRNSAGHKSSPPQHGILKDCQNSSRTVSPSQSQSQPSANKSSNIGNKENSTPNGASIETPKHHKTNISKEYSYDRTISYRMAMHEQPSEEMQKLAAALLDENADDSAVRKERSNSMPSKQYVQVDRLSPTKRSVSSSISNFFRKISPRMNRKSSRERSAKPASTSTLTSGSSTSLTTTSDPEPADDGHFSRSKVRQSFLKFINRTKSKSRSRSRDPEKRSAAAKDERNASRPNDSGAPNNKQSVPSSANRMLKSIERNALSDRDVYARFKDKQSPCRTGEVTHHHPGPRPVSARPTELAVGDHVVYDKSSLTSPEDLPVSSLTSPEDLPVTMSSSSDVAKADPPRSLDVVAPRVVKALQTSVMSTISGDESIGECSLDANFTGESTFSLVLIAKRFVCWKIFTLLPRSWYFKLLGHKQPEITFFFFFFFFFFVFFFFFLLLFFFFFLLLFFVFFFFFLLLFFFFFFFVFVIFFFLLLFFFFFFFFFFFVFVIFFFLLLFFFFFFFFLLLFFFFFFFFFFCAGVFLIVPFIQSFILLIKGRIGFKGDRCQWLS